MNSNNAWDQEILDIVNEHDEVIGQMTRTEVYAQEIFHQIRGVWLFIRNTEGRLWIPRRAAHKRACPLMLDGSAVGTVESGESYDQAIAREAKEELGIELHTVELRQVAKFAPREGITLCHVTIYELVSDECPPYDTEEFSEYYWLSPQELIGRLEAGDSSKSDLPKIVKQVYLKS